jgi:ribosome recycling factor
MREELKPYEVKMSGAIDHLSKELASIRAGRANPAILDKILVDYYSTPTPIQQIAAVSVAEARVLAIQPWEPSLISVIERALLTSDIGINPTNDGRVIRLVFPAPTEERRKELTKDVMKFAEETKVAIRNVRRDAIDKFKAQKKNGELTEDDLKSLENDVQKLTDQFVKECDKVADAKNKEILEL